MTHNRPRSPAENRAIHAKNGEAPKPKPVPATKSRPGGHQHKGYTLYTREVNFGGNPRQRIYFYSKHKPKSGTPAQVPPGYEVGESDKTGLPFLRKVS